MSCQIYQFHICINCKTNVCKVQCTLDIDGLVQDCSISIANDPEILQSGTKQSINVWRYLEPIPLTIFQSWYKFDRISFSSGCDEVIAAVLCTWHDSCISWHVHFLFAIWLPAMELRQTINALIDVVFWVTCEAACLYCFSLNKRLKKVLHRTHVTSL